MEHVKYVTGFLPCADVVDKCWKKKFVIKKTPDNVLIKKRSPVHFGIF